MELNFLRSKKNFFFQVQIFLQNIITRRLQHRRIAIGENGCFRGINNRPRCDANKHEKILEIPPEQKAIQGFSFETQFLRPGTR